MCIRDSSTCSHCFGCLNQTTFYIHHSTVLKNFPFQSKCVYPMILLTLGQYYCPTRLIRQWKLFFQRPPYCRLAFIYCRHRDSGWSCQLSLGWLCLRQPQPSTTMATALQTMSQLRHSPQLTPAPFAADRAEYLHHVLCWQYAFCCMLYVINKHFLCSCKRYPSGKVVTYSIITL